MNMKTFPIFLLCFIKFYSFSQTTFSNNYEKLFLIKENRKIGYIDSVGNIKVKPVYLAGNEFSEGLAAVRLNGTYGFIDRFSNYVIDSQYDYATEFKEGLAIVFKEGNPFFINRKGQKLFECNYKSINPYNYGLSIVESSTGNYGLINKQGKLVYDTIYSSISYLPDSMIVLNKNVPTKAYLDGEEYAENSNDSGVVDLNGNFIIPFGKIKSILGYSDGYFKVDYPREEWDTIIGFTAKTEILDHTGKLILTKDGKNKSYIIEPPHCGLMKMIFTYYKSNEDLDSIEESFSGYINLNNKIIYRDTNNYLVYNFSDNRAFVLNRIKGYSIINTSGKLIAKDAFNEINRDGFINGSAFVQVGDKWGLIDTNANYIIKPKFTAIEYDESYGDYFFYYEYRYDNKIKEKRAYRGIAMKDGSIILKAILQFVDGSGIRNGFLRCIIDCKLSYINLKGEIVWQEKETYKKSLIKYNCDYKNRIYFSAYSTPDSINKSQGWAVSNNIPIKSFGNSSWPINQLSVNVDLENQDTFKNIYLGWQVSLVNNTNKKIDFRAQDSRLYMKVQALNSKGEWKDIEYMPWTFCGNSYHRISLEPNYYWKFIMPQYEGEFKTKMRIELKYIDPEDISSHVWDRKEKVVYSNEFNGSVNPGQFWREEGHFPVNFMDPYFN